MPLISVLDILKTLLLILTNKAIMITVSMFFVVYKVRLNDNNHVSVILHEGPVPGVRKRAGGRRAAAGARKHACFDQKNCGGCRSRGGKLRVRLAALLRPLRARRWVYLIGGVVGLFLGFSRDLGGKLNVFWMNLLVKLGFLCGKVFCFVVLGMRCFFYFLAILVFLEVSRVYYIL